MSNILMTGGTGLVGTELVAHYLHQGNQVIVLTRSERTSEHPGLRYVNWQENGWETAIPNIDVVINLAGASLSERWTKEHKKAMLQSRIDTTERLYNFFQTEGYSPTVLFNASAIGYYPPSKSAVYDESHVYEEPHDFLSTIVHQWEAAAKKFEALGTRVVIGRFGVVFSEKGGALARIILPYKLFAGGQLGDGKQWFSWIHLDDVTRATVHLIADKQAEGAYNITSPNPIRQRHLGKLIGRIMARPHYAPVPASLLRVLLGEQATIILDVQKVLPKRLDRAGFTFHYPTALLALEDILAKEKA
ncbi:TIGR01777 family oxidoreductase [Gracilibacillus phocaeensis]|uniref:TIGR01777 family oxidoreductase n=1 Tax=Gracilibacillus phocaeensis TaxID=2042304 RepID=UPI001031608D|nr:TIGR01777 family oxidoreductase [Gracilibacillus phocaeensis]